MKVFNIYMYLTLAAICILLDSNLYNYLIATSVFIIWIYTILAEKKEWIFLFGSTFFGLCIFILIYELIKYGEI